MIERNFRHMPEGGFPMGVFESPVNPVVFISKDGASNFYQSEADKRSVLTSYLTAPEEDQKGLMVLFMWTGKFRSDVFEITKEAANSILGLKAE